MTMSEQMREPCPTCKRNVDRAIEASEWLRKEFRKLKPRSSGMVMENGVHNVLVAARLLGWGRHA